MTALTARPLPRRTARIALAGLALLFLVGLSVSVPSQPDRTRKNQGDVALFSTVMRRLRSGETYYPAMGRELLLRRYPTASVFNWRTPLIFQALATAPRLMLICLLAMGGLLVFGTMAVMIKAPPEVLLVALLAQIGATVSVISVPESLTLPEPWAGFLIGTSLLAYTRITIQSEPFPHLLFELVLSFSGWTSVALAASETFEALVTGLQG